MMNLRLATVRDPRTTGKILAILPVINLLIFSNFGNEIGIIISSLENSQTCGLLCSQKFCVGSRGVDPETVRICLSSRTTIFGPIETNVNICLIILWFRKSYRTHRDQSSRKLCMGLEGFSDPYNKKKAFQ